MLDPFMSCFSAEDTPHTSKNTEVPENKYFSNLELSYKYQLKKYATRKAYNIALFSGKKMEFTNPLGNQKAIQ